MFKCYQYTTMQQMFVCIIDWEVSTYEFFEVRVSGAELFEAPQVGP